MSFMLCFLFPFTFCKWHKQETVTEEMKQEHTRRKQHYNTATSYNKAIFQQ